MKRFISVFLSVCMLAGLLVLPAGAAESEEEWELTEYAESSAGFFYWLYCETGEEDAWEAWVLLTEGRYGDNDITTRKDGEYFSATELGEEGDATSLENLQKSIEFLKECNELRQSDDNSTDLQDLKVSSLLMAIAELDVNWSSTNIAHAQVFNVGENLAWGYSDPFDRWYDEEKEAYDESGSSSSTGHYENIIDPDYIATGFACSSSGGYYGTTHGQVFAANQGYDIYTVEEYAELLEEYLTVLDEEVTYDDFTDLAEADPDTNWYYEGVDYVIRKDIMNGVSSTLFSPDGTTTRTMIVTILYRLAGSPEVSGTSSFSDVVSGSWYEDAVIWAEENEIAYGYDSGEFGVEDAVTREQMAAFFYRYAVSQDYDVSDYEDLSTFPDADEVDDWAEAELAWAVGAELITGVGVGNTSYLNPTDTCTRSMTATIIYRFAEHFEE